MALVECVDCGREVSDQAPACPGCGRPNDLDIGNCPRCGEADTVTGTGLHGWLEITTTIVWTFTSLIIGLALYFSLSPRPWCPRCGNRPTGAVSDGSLTILLLAGLLWAWYLWGVYLA